MPNKLDDIFSVDEYTINGTLHFENNEAYQKMVEALNIVENEGKTVPIEGVTAITTVFSDKSGKYPISNHEKVSKLVLAPSKERVSFPVKIGENKKQIVFYRYATKNTFILESPTKSIINLKITFSSVEQKLLFNFEFNFHNANSISDVIESFSITVGFLSSLLSQENESKSLKEEKQSFHELLDYLKYYESLFKKLHSIESELEEKISPKTITEITEENQSDIEELYLLLCEKKILRINAKINSTDVELLKEEELIIGRNVKLVFSGNIRFDIFDKVIILQTANVLMNAIVKDIEKQGETTKIYYSDTDINPMYVSFSAYKTESEMQKELNSISVKESEYTNALTLSEHLNNLIR